MLVTHNLTWPSLTLEWLPEKKDNAGVSEQTLLLGTHTNGLEPDYLQYLLFETAERPKVSIQQKLSHEGEVNRARVQPWNTQMAATKTAQGDVLLYERSNAEPILRLTGHTAEGYGLAWNPHEAKKNHLLSAGFDHRVCHWDIGMSPDANSCLAPLHTYQGHTDCVEDISWHAVQPDLFASVADDQRLMIWDTRQPENPVHNVKTHTAEINSVAFHPKNDWMLATGSSDKTIGLFDIRKIQKPLHTLESHEGEVTQVAWSPHQDPILASAGSDRKVIVWDLSQIGKEQTPEDAEDGVPEVLFVHSGHTSKISDFSWNPIEPWVIASCAEDNVVQIWKMVITFFYYYYFLKGLRTDNDGYCFLNSQNKFIQTQRI
ncbi:WD40-repeat-containing domain protein [Sporodiniella umbellata]|nr:WD40-repeat-containing domain protein [Sporodiniella umbellata]